MIERAGRTIKRSRTGLVPVAGVGTSTDCRSVLCYIQTAFISCGGDTRMAIYFVRKYHSLRACLSEDKHEHSRGPALAGTCLSLPAFSATFVQDFPSSNDSFCHNHNVFPFCLGKRSGRGRSPTRAPISVRLLPNHRAATAAFRPAWSYGMRSPTTAEASAEYGWPGSPMSATRAPVRRREVLAVQVEA